jgi:UDP-N-acetylmuramate--alanine ligase
MDAFDLADAVFVTDVYSAGDEAIEGVNTSNFVSQMQKIRSNVFETTTENFARDVAQFVQSGDTVVCLNAGSLSRQIPELLEVLKK